EGAEARARSGNKKGPPLGGLNHAQIMLNAERQHPTAMEMPRQKPTELFRELVGARGFEPPTPRSRTECSTRLSHAPTGRNRYLTSDRTVNATLVFALPRVRRSR